MSEEKTPEQVVAEQFREVKKRLKMQSKSNLIAMLFQTHNLMTHYKELSAALQAEQKKEQV